MRPAIEKGEQGVNPIDGIGDDAGYGRDIVVDAAFDSVDSDQRVRENVGHPVALAWVTRYVYAVRSGGVGGPHECGFGGAFLARHAADRGESDDEIMRKRVHQPVRKWKLLFISHGGRV